MFQGSKRAGVFLSSIDEAVILRSKLEKIDLRFSYHSIAPVDTYKDLTYTLSKRIHTKYNELLKVTQDLYAFLATVDPYTWSQESLVQKLMDDATRIVKDFQTIKISEEDILALDLLSRLIEVGNYDSTLNLRDEEIDDAYIEASKLYFKYLAQELNLDAIIQLIEAKYSKNYLANTNSPYVKKVYNMLDEIQVHQILNPHYFKQTDY